MREKSNVVQGLVNQNQFQTFRSRYDRNEARSSLPATTTTSAFVSFHWFSLTFTAIDNSSIICICIQWQYLLGWLYLSTASSRRMLHICTLHKLVSERDFNKVSRALSLGIVLCCRMVWFSPVISLSVCRMPKCIAICWTFAAKGDALFTTFIIHFALSL